MMEGFTTFIFSLYGMFIFICFVSLIYLIIRRVNIKDRETFEKRDN